jgi:hypothetical protein
MNWFYSSVKIMVIILMKNLFSGADKTVIDTIKFFGNVVHNTNVFYKWRWKILRKLDDAEH